jgi:hypothetical protein
VNRRKPHVQTPIASRYPTPAPVHNFILLFLPPCGPHSTPLATRSLKLSLLVSPLLGGPARHRPFALTLHLHQRKSSRNLHLQYSAKSQSTRCCQSLIIATSDHPPVLRRSGPQPRWPPGPSSRAYLSLHSSEAPQGIDLSRPSFTVRHGYPWVPTDHAHGRPRQVGPAYQKTRRPVSGPN